MSGRRVAIVGATGAVGEELIRTLEQRDFPVAQLRLLASKRSAGRKLGFRGEAHTVEALGASSFQGMDLALFAAGSTISKDYAERAVSAGAVVVDNSSAFRMDPAVPLVVPELNGHTIGDHQGIHANPNSSTIIQCMALWPLHQAAGLDRVVVATYQAASGAGGRAMQEMWESFRVLLGGNVHRPQVLQHSLAFNLFPHVDVFQPDGYTREEDKMQDETRKILGLPDLRVEATCVRVPVERCHSEAVTVELHRPLSPDQARDALAAFAGVEVLDDPEQARFPQPIHVSGRDPVVVGRVRQSRVFQNGLALWVVADQLRKGAALNAVQIAESL